MKCSVAFLVLLGVLVLISCGPNPVYGPVDVGLEHSEGFEGENWGDRWASHAAGVRLIDFTAGATFLNPHSADSGKWTHEFWFRQSGRKGLVLSISAGPDKDHPNSWTLVEVEESPNPNIDILELGDFDRGLLERKAGGRNRIGIIANGNEIRFHVNGTYSGSFPVSVVQSGDVVVAAFASLRNGVTRIEDFEIYPN